MLNCGLHKCPQSCHNLIDHSHMACTAMVKKLCPENHVMKRRCHDSALATCRKCQVNLEEAEKKSQTLCGEEEQDMGRRDSGAELAGSPTSLNSEESFANTDMRIEESQNTFEEHRKDRDSFKEVIERYENSSDPVEALESPQNTELSNTDTDKQQLLS